MMPKGTEQEDSTGYRRSFVNKRKKKSVKANVGNASVKISSLNDSCRSVLFGYLIGRCLAFKCNYQ